MTCCHSTLSVLLVTHDIAVVQLAPHHPFAARQKDHKKDHTRRMAAACLVMTMPGCPVTVSVALLTELAPMPMLCFGSQYWVHGAATLDCSSGNSRAKNGAL